MKRLATVILLFAQAVLFAKGVAATDLPIQTTGFENDPVGRTPDYVFRASGYADYAFVRAGTPDFPAHSGANMLFGGEYYYLYPPQRNAMGIVEPFSSISFWYYIPNPHSDTGTASFSVMDGNRETIAGVEVTQFDTGHFLSVPQASRNPSAPRTVAIGAAALFGGHGETTEWAIDDVTFVIREPRISLLFLLGVLAIGTLRSKFLPGRCGTHLGRSRHR